MKDSIPNWRRKFLTTWWKGLLGLLIWNWLASCMSDIWDTVQESDTTAENALSPEKQQFLQIVETINNSYSTAKLRGENFGPFTIYEYLKSTIYRKRVHELYLSNKNLWFSKWESLQLALWRFFAEENIYLNIENARASQWEILQKIEKLVPYDLSKNPLFTKIYKVEDWKKVNYALVNSWNAWIGQWTYADNAWIPVVFSDITPSNLESAVATDEITHYLNCRRFWTTNTIQTWKKRLESNDVIAVKNTWMLNEVVWDYTYQEANEWLSMIGWVLDPTWWKIELQRCLKTILAFNAIWRSGIGEDQLKYNVWSMAILISIFDTDIGESSRSLIEEFKTTIREPDFDRSQWNKLYDTMVQNVWSLLHQMDWNTFQGNLLNLSQELYDNCAHTHDLRNK